MNLTPKRRLLVDRLRAGWEITNRGLTLRPGQMKTVPLRCGAFICSPPSEAEGHEYQIPNGELVNLAKLGVLRAFRLGGRRQYALAEEWRGSDD